MIMVGCWLKLPKMDRGNYKKIKIHSEMNFWTKLDQIFNETNLNSPLTIFHNLFPENFRYDFFR